MAELIPMRRAAAPIAMTLMPISTPVRFFL
jgi:hypothetical protein